jgi:hypothetical protein
MTMTKYHRYSISLDRGSHDRCKVLASERTTSVSGLLRILIKDAYEQHQTVRRKEDSGPCA